MTVLEALADAAGGHAGEAGDADAVDGTPARWTAAPGSTEEAAAVLRVAAAHDLAVVARGAGTKLGWAAPPRRVDLLVDTGRLDRIVEHAAGDLVVVAQAGVTLAALAGQLAGAGQRLAIDEVVPGSTVGGVLATGLTGPRRLQAGAVRDLVLGATLVRADGVVTKSGGKVVKNVAGYDVAKLVCGAYGTLGLVTEAAFRLHPVSPAAAYATVRVAGPAEAYAAVQRVLHAQFVPSALEVDRPEPGGPVEVALLVEGTEAGVAARMGPALAALGPGAGETARPVWWSRLPAAPGRADAPGGPGAPVGADAPGGPGAPVGADGAGGVGGVGAGTAGEVLVKATAELAGVGRLLAGIEEAGPAAVRGSAGIGVFHLGVPARDAAGFVHRLRAAAPGWAGSVVVLAAPPAVREAVDAWGPVPGLTLMHRIKEQFDPGRRLAPGRFVGGI